MVEIVPILESFSVADAADVTVGLICLEIDAESVALVGTLQRWPDDTPPPRWAMFADRPLVPQGGGAHGGARWLRFRYAFDRPTDVSTVRVMSRQCSIELNVALEPAAPVEDRSAYRWAGDVEGRQAAHEASGRSAVVEDAVPADIRPIRAGSALLSPLWVEEWVGWDVMRFMLPEAQPGLGTIVRRLPGDVERPGVGLGGGSTDRGWYLDYAFPRTGP